MSNEYERGRRAGRNGGEYKLPHGGDNPFRIHTDKQLKDRNDYDEGYQVGRSEREQRGK